MRPVLVQPSGLVYLKVATSQTSSVVWGEGSVRPHTWTSPQHSVRDMRHVTTSGTHWHTDTQLTQSPPWRWTGGCPRLTGRDWPPGLPRATPPRACTSGAGRRSGYRYRPTPSRTGWMSTWRSAGWRWATSAQISQTGPGECWVLYLDWTATSTNHCRQLSWPGIGKSIYWLLLVAGVEISQRRTVDPSWVIFSLSTSHSNLFRILCWIP